MDPMGRAAHSLTPAHPAIRAYLTALGEYRAQGVEHELGLRSAFQNLLDTTARLQGWTLFAEQSARSGGRNIRFDGTLRDRNSLPRGYWEAKDSRDDLDREIERKIRSGYFLTNTIFEDTCHAVLYQDRDRVLEADLADPRQIADLLARFYSWTEPDIRGFEEAVGEFEERVPDLARGLALKVEEAHRDNRRFQEAFAGFFSLCQLSLNPNLRREAVDEMLVQHLLTERLIRTIFNNPGFTRRNVIARDVEDVIDALVSESFSREEYLKGLDRFYSAIEAAARIVPDFSDKQRFLNHVYERFFRGYSVKVADTHGIVYTPPEIVEFMCASVEEALQQEFGLSLSSPGVNIIDPCTGTGNFIVHLMRRMPRRDLPRVYREQLFANEVMLLPYYIAALNIEHEYLELTGKYEPFEGLCFVDTLDMAEDRQMPLFTERNADRVKRQKETPITVVIGNPPYNVGQLNENDNNKNRKYPVIDRRIAATYAKDSTATLKNKLSDAYVKFFRWATDRLDARDGIVCFVSNNSFVDQMAFDGMRKHLLKNFDHIDHVDLHGNVRKNPKLSGTTHNVFGIQVGVGVTLAVRNKALKKRLRYHRVPEDWRKEEKLAWLEKREVPWKPLKPDANYTWLVPENADEYAAFVPLAETFCLCSLGACSNRDEWVYDFSGERIRTKVRRLIANYNSEVFRYAAEDPRPVDIDGFVNTAANFVKWTDRLKSSLASGRTLKFSEALLRSALYRPFTGQSLYFDDLLVHRRYRQHEIFPTSAAENRAIAVTHLASEKPFMVLAVDRLCDLHLVGAGCGTQCFPFHTYAPDGTNRKENITDEALKRFREAYGDERVTKWEIFHYIYAILHHPGYREKFAENLKRELPRIPFALDFHAFAKAGKELARLHVEYESLEPWPLDFICARDEPLSYEVRDKMRLSKDKTALQVNSSLTLAGIPPEVYEYRLGNRSALEWVVDQYQVSEDARSGIRSDPNRKDDPEYIVRLVGQVVRVSLETVRLVRSLPAEYSR
jgi:predicted helicase